MTWGTNLKELVKSLAGVRPSPTVVADIFRDPLWDPVAVRLARILAHSMGAFGERRLFVAFAILSCPPSVVLFLGDPQAPSPWVLGLWVINCFGMISIPYIVWKSLNKAAAELDRLFFPASNPSRTQFVHATTARLRNRWQVISGAIVGGGTAGVMLYEHASRDQGVWLVIGYAYVGALVGSSGYLLIITALLCRSLAKSNHLGLHVLNPLDTPGLRLASDAMRQLATFGLGLDFTFNLALAFRYHATDPKHRNAEAIIVVMIVGLLFLIMIGIQSQRWLAEPGTRAIRQQLDAIEGRVEPALLESDTAGYGQRSQEVQARQAMRLYIDKLSLKTSYVDINLVTAYSTAGFGVLLQLALSGVFGS